MVISVPNGLAAVSLATRRLETLVEGRVSHRQECL
jgi:hypothetical protein